MVIKDSIKQLRKKRCWSQTQLAQKMEIHQKQVSVYERGRNVPSTEVLIKLVDIFDVSLDYLAFEAEGQSAKVNNNIKDRELLRRFEEIDKLNEKDKGTIKEILDTFILKNRFQSLAAPKEL
jgi:transcriptional regulator with XRE-family HTH domain